MTTMERNEQKFLGKTLFIWESWDEVDVGELFFYDVEFSFESMKKYNGLGVILTLEGLMKIYNEDGTKVVWSGFPTDIEEWNQ